MPTCGYISVCPMPRKGPLKAVPVEGCDGATNCSVTLCIQVPGSTAWKVLRKVLLNEEQLLLDFGYRFC